MQRLKSQVHDALRRGAAWGAVAGLSGGVFLWMVVEGIRKAITN